MNSAAIAAAAKQIGHLEEALVWLREHGRQGLDPADRDSFSVCFSLNSCSSLRGSKEAAVQLSAIARLHGNELLAHAITDAENTIEILRSRIAAEVAAT